MKYRSFSALTLLFFSLFPALGFANVITVRQDGSGDHLTITSAVASASPTDTIEVGPGTYAESIDLYVPLTFMSTNGASSTVMDGLNNTHHLWFFNAAGSEVIGFKFINGFNSSGGGSIRAQGGAQLRVRDCAFENNRSNFHAGAVFVRDFPSRVEVDNCVFVGNTAVNNGGAATTILNGQLLFTNCTLVQNSTGGRGGAIATNDNSVLEVVGCVFRANTSGFQAGALYIEDTFGQITGSTFHAHTSPGDGTVRVYSSSGTAVNRNIFSGETAGYGLYYAGAVGAHSCNVFWNNADGAIGNAGLGTDDTVADPLFCNAPAGDLTISTTSPAAPAHSLCGQLIGALPTACTIGSPPATEEPVILSILDVGNDEGRQVRVKWGKSVYDAPDDGIDVTGYAVYRRQDAFLKSSLPKPGSAGQAGSSTRAIALVGWDYLVTVPARGDSTYQYVAPTLCDSTGEGVCWSAFFVSALTPDPLEFFDSNPDSGYSIDNIDPEEPDDFSVAYNNSAGNRLSWTIPSDPEIVACNVYRGTSPDFIPGSQNLVHSTAALFWLDATGNSQHHYKLTTMDDGGNESSPVAPEIITGGPRERMPRAYALYQNEPNPFNPTTEITYDVPRGGAPVMLSIYDVSGRLVRRLVDAFETAGQNQVTWDGRDDRGGQAASGVYFCRLRTPRYDKTVKMTLVQ